MVYGDAIAIVNFMGVVINGEALVAGEGYATTYVCCVHILLAWFEDHLGLYLLWHHDAFGIDLVLFYFYLGVNVMRLCDVLSIIDIPYILGTLIQLYLIGVGLACNVYGTGQRLIGYLLLYGTMFTLVVYVEGLCHHLLYTIGSAINWTWVDRVFNGLALICGLLRYILVGGLLMLAIGLTCLLVVVVNRLLLLDVVGLLIYNGYLVVLLFVTFFLLCFLWVFLGTFHRCLTPPGDM